MYNTSPIDPPLQGKHIVCRCLPILGAGVLVFWLSGGLIPRAWLSFFQTCVHFHTLWAERGAVVLLLLFIQLVQSLLLGGAWGLLGWLAVQEGTTLYEMFSDTRQTSAPALASSPTSKLLQLQLPQRRSATGQQQKILRISPQIARKQSRGDTAAPLSPIRDDGISRGMQMSPSKDQRLWAYEDDLLKNPFEDWEAAPSTQNVRQMTNPFNDWEAFPPAQSAQPAQRNDRAHSKNSEGRLVRLPSHQQEFMGEHPLFEEAGQSVSSVQQDDIMNPFFIDEKRLAAFRQKEAAINQPDLAGKRQPGTDIPQPGTGSVHSVQELEQSSPEHGGEDFSFILNQMGFLPRQQPDSKQRLEEAQMQQVSLAAMAQHAAEAEVKPSLSTKRAAMENSSAERANPFDVQRDVLELFQSERSLATPPGSGSQSVPSNKPAIQYEEPEAGQLSVQHDEPRPSGNTAEYVFGNPFDGPLPDIFEHDEDLKRAISEQNKGRSRASFSSNQPVPNEEEQAQKRKKRRSRGSRGGRTSSSDD